MRLGRLKNIHRKPLPIRAKLMLGLLVFSTVPVVALGWFVCAQVDRAQRRALGRAQEVAGKDLEQVRQLRAHVARSRAEGLAEDLASLFRDAPAAAATEGGRARLLERAAARHAEAGCAVRFELVTDEQAEATPKEPREEQDAYRHVAAIPDTSFKVAAVVDDTGIQKDLDYLVRDLEQFGRLSEEEGTQSTVNLKVLLVLGVAALVATLTLIGGEVARAVTRPIEKLTRAAEEISHGEQHPDLDVGGGAEIRLLSAAFKRATDDLQTYADSLEQRNVELDDARRLNERLARQDSLTNVRTRRVFQEVLAHEWEHYARHDAEFCVILVDLDYFKEVNDQFGHQAGDDALRVVGAVLNEHSRGCDLVGRYGGDEFVILLPKTDVEGARTVAERLTRQIRTAQFSTPGLSVTLSIGVASCRGKAAPDEALHAADNALYEAKRAGRDRVVAHSPNGVALPVRADVEPSA